MGQIGSVQVGIHAPRLELHRRDMQLLVGKLGVGMIAIEFVDGAIDLLTHLPRPLRVARGWHALDALRFAAGAQLRFAAALLAVPLLAVPLLAVPLLAVPLLALGERASAGAVMRASAG